MHFSSSPLKRVRRRQPKVLRSCLGVMLVVVVAGVLALWVAYPRVKAYMPYPEWLPVKTATNITFGIDVSHYQGKIKWKEVKCSHHPIQFVFLRATMGVDGRDVEFRRNWKEAHLNGFTRGAYHFYRPNEPSAQQFENFKSVVQLKAGDLPPVLDVETMSTYGRENLRKGVRNWISLCEAHYGCKPIVYSGRTFYLENLVGAVDECPLWIAAYSGKHRVRDIHWTFHQFTERVKVKGIRGNVDGNDFRGTFEQLKAFTLD